MVRVSGCCTYRPNVKKLVLLDLPCKGMAITNSLNVVFNAVPGLDGLPGKVSL